MIYDVTIIGGGPAGVAAGVYAARKQLKTLFITKDWNSQSTVSEGIENWIGTIKISGADFAKSLEGHLRAYAKDFVDIHTSESAEKIEKIDGGFKITTSKGSYESKTVLLTAGSFRKKLEAKGADIFEHKGLTYCASCDGPLFAGQDVVVIGGGIAAFESASQLLAYCKSVTLINRTDKFRADPVTIEAVSKNPHFKIVTNAISKEVKGEKFVNGYIYTDSKTGKDTELAVAAIFVEIGSVPTTYFAKDLVKMTEYNQIIVDPKTQRASVDGVWAAGDCTDGLYHQNNIAAGDAVKALEDIYLFLKAK
ncbi:MAG: NADH-dependent peroxiredoxin subunit [Patescibacteria group bacterium]|nr:NADH-dependent peroxiredoxin subunit [Patescibacteria group bacterium]